MGLLDGIAEDVSDAGEKSLDNGIHPDAIQNGERLDSPERGAVEFQNTLIDGAVDEIEVPAAAVDQRARFKVAIDKFGPVNIDLTVVKRLIANGSFKCRVHLPNHPAENLAG